MNPMIRCLVLLAALTVPTAYTVRCLRDDVASKSAQNKLYSGQIAFSLNMLGAVLRRTLPKDNVLFSPYSTFNTLLVAYLGANDRLEHELAEALGLHWASSKEQVSKAYRDEKEQLIERLKKMPLEFSTVDKIFIDKKIQIPDCWKKTYSDVIGALDFAQPFLKVRDDINNWFEIKTREAIPSILSANDVAHSLQVLSASADNFKGQWVEVFDNKTTKDGDFFCGTKDKAPVKMMRKRGRFNFATIPELDADILQLPYVTDKTGKKRSEISMVIILPKAKDDYTLDNLLKKLTPHRLQKALKRCLPKNVAVSFPKFVLEKNVELQPILRALGLRALFDDPAALTGFSPSPKLSFDVVKHAARIKIDEAGNPIIPRKSLYRHRGKLIEFNCNHPFMFLIYDHKARTVLFTGLYRNPAG